MRGLGWSTRLACVKTQKWLSSFAEQDGNSPPSASLPSPEVLMLMSITGAGREGAAGRGVGGWGGAGWDAETLGQAMACSQAGDGAGTGFNS